MKKSFWIRFYKMGIESMTTRLGARPKGAKWQQILLTDDCCEFDVPVIAELQTITFNYLTPDVIVYRVHLIGEQGQGVYVTENLDEINVQRTLEIPKTGTYTVVLEVVTGAEGYTISLSNSGIVGFKDAGFPTISYNAYTQDLTGVTVMNTTTPQV